MEHLLGVNKHSLEHSLEHLLEHSMEYLLGANKHLLGALIGAERDFHLHPNLALFSRIFPVASSSNLTFMNLIYGPILVI